ncbi:MAG: glycosyltransferase family 2 protein [Bacteroidales bacterium]|nr:glycosyltransferase family 2 protein [Bacteroidales bacterium]
MNPEINKVAVLLTCHNRKDKTLACLRHLYASKDVCPYPFEMQVYLTDDGSIDGTSYAIEKDFPEIIILPGNGSLFWAGGMRNSWNEAHKKEYHAFLLLNDDTMVDMSCFDQIFETHEYSIKTYGMAGIYIGSVRNPKTGEFTYGGRNLKNKWTFETQKIFPDGTIEECQLGNANIMFVTHSVVDTLGIFNAKYIHRKADYDYTLRALEQKIPVLVCPEYCGSCIFDYVFPNIKKMNLKERMTYLKSPKGIEFSAYMYFMKRFFPWRAPFVFISLWLKTLLPNVILPPNKAV